MITDNSFVPFILASGDSIVHLAMFIAGMIVTNIHKTLIASVEIKGSLHGHSDEANLHEFSI